MDAIAIADLFAVFGPVSVRRMFGGAGIFADGAMIGLVFDDMIYLRTDEAMRVRFRAEGSVPFQFDKPSAGKTVVTGYYSLPARLYDDAEALAEYARGALALALEKKASQKTASGKRVPGPKAPPRRPPVKRPRARG